MGIFEAFRSDRNFRWTTPQEHIDLRNKARKDFLKPTVKHGLLGRLTRGQFGSDPTTLYELAPWDREKLRVRVKRRISRSEKREIREENARTQEALTKLKNFKY